MSTNHNRIRVADLETNQPNKILKTNAKGELEFSDANNLQTENYNALDCTTEGKSLDARQGKVLKDMIDLKPVDLASDAETQISATVSEDKKVISRLKLFNWWGWIKSQTQTISGMWNFTNKVTLAVSTSNTPALIIPNGTLANTAQNGAIERDSSGKLWTTRLGTRYQILENDGSVISLISNAPQSNSDESFSINTTKERTINILPVGTFHNFIVSKFTYLGNYYTSNGYGATSMKIDIILRITNGVFCNSVWGGPTFKDIILFTYSGNSSSSINNNILITGYNNGTKNAENGSQSEINGIQIRTADNTNQMFLKDASFIILERKTITFANPTNSLGTNQNVRFLSYTTASYIEKIR